MWCDILTISIPLFAIGFAANRMVPLCISLAIFLTGLTGMTTSLYRITKDKPARASPIYQDISMIATYVWPSVLGGLIVEEYGLDGIPFYLFAGFLTIFILMFNHDRNL